MQKVVCELFCQTPRCLTKLVPWSVIGQQQQLYHRN
jgi:hypothetical protein